MDDARPAPATAAHLANRIELERQERIAALTADISARLRRPCADMPDDQFSAMVLDIALMQLRFREIEARSDLPAARTPMRVLRS